MMQSDGWVCSNLTRGMQPFLALSGTWIVYTLQTDIPYHREICDSIRRHERQTTHILAMARIIPMPTLPASRRTKQRSHLQRKIRRPLQALQCSRFDWDTATWRLFGGEARRRTLTPASPYNTGQLEPPVT